jgi:agmatine deiminase
MSPTESPMTPRQAGYRWPAEWEPHAATWLAWPHNPQTWPGKFQVIPPIFARLVATIAEFEPVKLLAGRPHVAAQARELVGHLANVELLPIDTNDAWCRDHGPMFLTGAGLQKAVVDWGYNAWGEKYPPYDQDNLVPLRIAQRTNAPRFDPQMILEGGSVEGNGEGCLLTTASCLLHPRRNPQLTRDDIEARLRDYACARRVLWLTGGDFAGDDTDGHIDQLARFAGPRTIVAAWCDDRGDQNYGVLQQLHQELAGLTDDGGRPFDIVRLPIPVAKYHQGQRLPASYCNYYLVNGAVIVPLFDDPADDVACDVLQSLFPERRIVGSPALDLIWGLGAFHCLSQQEPAG